MSNNYVVRREQGFEVYLLANQKIELSVVPELGAKIISLKDLSTGRDWMWRPTGGLKLFRNRRGDDFSRSPLCGWDECLPTIAPCSWQERALPDHGEVWAVPWDVDCEAWSSGVLRSSVVLGISPLEFERIIELRENEIHLSYRLTNRSDVEQQFLWAMHPLLRLVAGDRLNLPVATRTLLNGESWIDAVDSTVPQGNCAKVYAQPVVEGFAGIYNRDTGDRIQFEWDPAENNTLGLWLTRGGWHGHHHLALEPANGAAETLADAAENNSCGVIPARGFTTWQICVRVGQ